MMDHPKRQPGQTFAVDGTPVTPANLPPPRPARWTPRRKAMVVAAVQAGILDMDAACERYEMSVEEFLAWHAAVRDSGLVKLSVSHGQAKRSI